MIKTTSPKISIKNEKAQNKQTPVIPTSSALKPLGLSEVIITDGYWAEWQKTNGSAIIEHIENWLERDGWLPNFDLAASGSLPEGRRGREFSDSEVYKYLEALAWEIGRTGNSDLEQRFVNVAGRIINAQESDGYLNTNFGRVGQAPRWSDLEWGHELYVAGHFFQAAVARERTRPGGSDGIYVAALRLADLICEVFSEEGIQSVCGHPEVEMAMVELGRLSGKKQYIEQARIFIERRGHNLLKDIEFGRSYYQDDLPVREATVLRGHAVRANYLASGAVDVGVETSDGALLQSLSRQWQNAVAKRTYITGGQGSRHQGEAFGEDFELPADRAYSETCAAVASVQFSWRMLLANGKGGYADLIERTLFNVIATSPSSDGKTFYYANTLHCRVPGTPVDVNAVTPRAESSLRAPWFEVTCCPPNLARTFASLSTLLATIDSEGLQLHQYASALITTELEDGEKISMKVETRYPTDGLVQVQILADAKRPWTLSFRVPAWVSQATLRLVDGAGGEGTKVSSGYAQITRKFCSGDIVELFLPLDTRFIHPDPRIDGIRGCVAVERGPIVYALESVDLPFGVTNIDEVKIDTANAPEDKNGRVHVSGHIRNYSETDWPYASYPNIKTNEPISFELVPYSDWAERGPSAMRVWIPTI